MQSTKAIIYTDGSCNTQSLTGAWVAIIFISDKKKRLSGIQQNTTHNRMELQAVIEAIQFLKEHHKEISNLTIYTDSQYVTGLQRRKEKLVKLEFTSKKGKLLQNADLVKRLLNLYELFSIETIKIKAHQQLNGTNEFNIEADHLSRQMVREATKITRSSATLK